MTILTEGQESFYLTVPAAVLDTSRDMASWASKHVVENANYKWILARYVEADNANSNGQYWTYEDLQVSRPSIEHSPMNVDHHAHDIVGHWANAEMMIPTEASSVLNPYIETLGVFYQYYFPELMKEVADAYEMGQLFVSMECVSETVTCAGDDGCGQEFAYAGPNSKSYCEHIQERSSYRQLNKPDFKAGALIMPGNRPGWTQADVKEISKLTTDSEKEKILHDIATTNPEGTEKDWENLMWSLQMQFLQTHAALK